MRTPVLILTASLALTGCITTPYNERYVAKRPELDPQTREAILQHRVILGMFPDEAIAAAGRFRSRVKADKTRWGEDWYSQTQEIIYSQRSQPDDSYIDLVFWNRTQFDTPDPVGFKVVFEHGRAASITRIHRKEEDARLSQAEATRIAREAAVQHGYRLADYRKTTARYALMKDGFWMAFFEHKVRPFDKHFTIWIDDQSGEVRVEPWKQE